MRTETASCDDTSVASNCIALVDDPVASTRIASSWYRPASTVPGMFSGSLMTHRTYPVTDEQGFRAQYKREWAYETPN